MTRLLELALKRHAPVMTNDFNLAKVAQVRGVQILNINELANALKPTFLPGETMSVFIVKDGKEPGQGVGYLDDGTMVVVDGARADRGETVGLVVTSVLQTSAGKMVFGKKPTEADALRPPRGAGPGEPLGLSACPATPQFKTPGRTTRSWSNAPLLATRMPFGSCTRTSIDASI